MSSIFSVTLINEAEGTNHTIAVNEDDLILDVAQEEGLDLPYSCRAGSCFDCLGRLVEGKIDHTEKATSFLKPKEIDEGYVLLCSATPSSDCKIVTHYAQVVFD
jgi:ferredoxin